MSGFWRSWLTVWCWVVGLFGLGLVGGGLEASSAPVRLLFWILNGPEPLDLTAQMRFSLTVMGAVTIGWSLTMAAAVQAAVLLGERGRSIWVLLVGAVSCWFLIDTPMSIVTGYAMNAVPNTLIFAAFLLPILRGGVLKRA